MKKYQKIKIISIIMIICSVFISIFLNLNKNETAFADVGANGIQTNINYTYVDTAILSGYPYFGESSFSKNIKLTDNFTINSSYATISNNYGRIVFQRNSSTYYTANIYFYDNTDLSDSTKYYYWYILINGSTYTYKIYYRYYDNETWNSITIADTSANSYINGDYLINYTFLSITLDTTISNSITTQEFTYIRKAIGFKSIKTPTYNVTYNLINCSATPSSILGYQDNTISITPYSGYNYPSTISYIGTADDIQYFDDTGEIVITNPTSDFTIEAEASSLGFTIRYGAYILPKYESFKNLNDFSAQTNGNFYFLNYALGNQYTINDQDIYYPFLTTQATTYQSYTLTKSGGNLTVLDSNNVGKTIIGYDNLDFDAPAYAYYQLNILIVPTSFQTQNSNLRYFFNSCYLIEANYNDVAATINQQFAYNNYLYKDLENERLNAYSNGYHHGLDIGYQIGYDEGINTNIISDSVTGVISAIFEGLFGNIFAIEIFPGFPLYLFILIPVVFAILGIVLWLVRGK